jgi:hypothetical protein
MPNLCFCIRWDTLHRTLVFSSDGICGSCSGFRCFQDAKCVHNFSCSGGTDMDYHKKRAGTRYTELVFLHSCRICESRSATRYVRGTKPQRAIFHAQVGPVWIPQKARRDTLQRTCVFTSSGICGSRSAFSSVRGVKHQCTIFHAQVGPMHFS